MNDDVSGSEDEPYRQPWTAAILVDNAGKTARRDDGVKQIGRSRMPSPDFAAFLLPLKVRGCGEAMRPKDLPFSICHFRTWLSARLGHDLRE